METLVRILIVSDDDEFIHRIKELTAHPQVVVENRNDMPLDADYHFYVIGKSASSILKKMSIQTPIYLAGASCDESIPLKYLVNCNLAGCVETEEGLRLFIKRVISFRKQQIKIREAATKLDCLKTGDLKALARHMTRTKSERFVDFIQNHPLPMILVSREGEVLHANAAMEEMIGTNLPGMPAYHFWADPSKYDAMAFDLKEEGQLLGREVTLKNIDGEPLNLKLYTSLHRNVSGEWLNTRCLFVPIDHPCQ